MTFSDALDTINEWIEDNAPAPFGDLAGRLNDIRDERNSSSNDNND